MPAIGRHVAPPTPIFIFRLPLHTLYDSGMSPGVACKLHRARFGSICCEMRMTSTLRIYFEKCHTHTTLDDVRYRRSSTRTIGRRALIIPRRRCTSPRTSSLVSLLMSSPSLVSNISSQIFVSLRLLQRNTTLAVRALAASVAHCSYKLVL